MTLQELSNKYWVTRERILQQIKKECAVRGISFDDMKSEREENMAHLTPPDTNMVICLDKKAADELEAISKTHMIDKSILVRFLITREYLDLKKYGLIIFEEERNE